MITKLTIVTFLPTASKYSCAIGILKEVPWTDEIDWTENSKAIM